jgi:hypothetical protein
LTATIALALGIAATIAILSIVNAALLRPLAVRDPDRFVLAMSSTVGHKSQKGRTWALRSDEPLGAMSPNIMGLVAFNPAWLEWGPRPPFSWLNSVPTVRMSGITFKCSRA